jgi:hypothetical protein
LTYRGLYVKIRSVPRETRKEKKEMMFNKEAVEQMTDSYDDRIIDAWNGSGSTRCNFPALLIKECKAMHEEISWAEEGGWLSSEDAEALWSHIEETAEAFMKDWKYE